MAMADEGDKGEPPGLEPRTRRSAATRATGGDMAGGGGEEEREREGTPGYVLSLPAAPLPLPVAVSCLDATVRRKARSRLRLRSQPSGWWAFKLPVVPAPEEARRPVPPASAVNNPTPTEEVRPRPRPQRVRMRGSQAPPPDQHPHTPAAAGERPAKRARICLQCGAAVTPQWRSGPMGQGTLCNACGVRLKAAGALRGQVQHRSTPPRTAARPPPPDSPVSESSPDSPIWEPGSVPDVYLVRKKPLKRGRPPPLPPPRTKPAPAPVTAAAPAVYLVKKKKKKKAAAAGSAKKPWRPLKSAKQCVHCGSSSTPQWREGPLGRSTLCNACGVRYRQGRLLPEYRPMASPTFQPSEHANRHSQVLQLHRQRKRQSHHHHHHPLPVEKHHPRAMDVLQFPPEQWHVKEEYPPTPLHQPLPHPVVDGSLDEGVEGGMVDAVAGAVHGGGGGSGKGSDLNNAPSSSLDSLLLEGPSAPLLVDGDEPLIDD